MRLVPLLVLAAACGAAAHPAESSPVTLDALGENQHVLGFRVVTLYLDDADKPTGARFIHDQTGFVFDYLRIESAPQGYIWVGTFPTSDMGEPHTQEHLLLGKGNKGRYLGSSETMRLADSSAFTGQWRTAYHFNTVASHQVYWSVLETQLDSLLHPDYSDEEIRREVRNFGIAKQSDGSLRLEEKGTVYNEMVRTYEEPGSLAWLTHTRLLYGDTHPLAYESGGTPEGLRKLTAADIRRFHAANYRLGNMGLIGAYPSSMGLADVLRKTAEILDKFDDGKRPTFMTERDLPAPRTAAAGTLQIVEYPLADAQGPGAILFGWAPTRDLSSTDHVLLELFASAFAGDESSILYKKLVDSSTRAIDIGATAVWSLLSSDQGMPLRVGVENVKAGSIDQATLEKTRELAMAELRRLAALPDGDPALLEFDDKVKSRVVAARRGLSKFLSSPPGFGFRGISSAWADHLLDLERSPGFRKSITLRPELAAIDALLASGKNPWRDRLKTWGLLEPPITVAAKASPALRERLDAERQKRVDDEGARLAAGYGTMNHGEALRKYQADYDAITATEEAAAKAQPSPPFTDAPPLTNDDELLHKSETVAGVPMEASTFESMPSATIGIAFRLDAVPAELLPYLAVLPSLLVDAGIHGGGVSIRHDEMKERMRREILGLGVSYQGNLRTGRAELLITASGNDVAEAKKALEWARLVMTSPDWRAENLPRLRDVVAQNLAGLRTRMLGPEESWVNNPAAAYWRQDQPLFLHTRSFLTTAHDAHRLAWQLEEPSQEVALFLDKLAAAGGQGRVPLDALVKSEPPEIKALSPAGQTLARKALRSLGELLADLPDDSLAADWAYLCRQMAADLRVPPATALDALNRARAAIFASGNARMWMVGSSASQRALAADLAATVGVLSPAKPAAQHLAAHRLVDERLRVRVPAATRPVFVGLVNRNTGSGVFLNSAPIAYFSDTSDGVLVDYLAANLYSGHGAHGLFIKTWGAGLAYSNGLRPNVVTGRLSYYAERCPALTQTLQFVIDELRRAKLDASLVDYAIAQAFDSRVAADFESRAQAMADDLADGVTPDLVRAFRERLLALRKDPDIAGKTFARLEAVDGRVLPGYGPKKAEVDGGVYFVIGPEAQLDGYQRWLENAEGKGVTLYRLYPRDFWAVSSE